MRHGGRREGAGRKPRPLIPQVDQGIASHVLAMPADGKTGWPGEEQRWLELLNAGDERLRFDVQKYLTDRRDGKPAQGVFVGDTREGARALERGNLPSHFEAQSGRRSGKPN
jgi:hypothetical protein